MAFHSNEGNKKQRIRLSEYTSNVLKADMTDFAENKLSTFLNRIIELFSPIANTSIARRLSQVSTKLEAIFSELRIDDVAKDRITRALLTDEEKKLRDMLYLANEGVDHRFSLNNNNLDYLSGLSSECEEERFFKRRRDYIECLLEEYARLPYIQRERIYYTDRFQQLEEAIEKRYRLHLTTDHGEIFIFWPHRILCDKLATATYIVGLSAKPDDLEENRTPCSFRISALANIVVQKSKSGFLSIQKKKDLDDLLTKRGVQFMLDGEREIRVRLTLNGIWKYQRQVHLRPSLISQEDDIWTFRCTLKQAEFYFFKFGSDAEVLSPTELRETMSKLYYKAWMSYSDIPEPQATY